MRSTYLVLALFCWSSSAMAQGTAVPPVESAPPPMAATSPPTAGRTNQDPSLDTRPQDPGRNVVASDGVSTRTVKAVPCGKAARETDGVTTCIGIPERGTVGRVH